MRALRLRTILGGTLSNALAIEELAAQLLLDAGEPPPEFWSFPLAGFLDPPLAVNRPGELIFVRAPRASRTARYLVFPLSPTGFFDGIDKSTRVTVLNRCLRAGLARLRPGSFLPPSWG